VTDTSQKDTTHFGFREVGKDEKPRLVADVFHSVADKYDVMNDLMSFGIHRLWKQFTVNLSGVRLGDRILDIAAGSGDLTEKFARRVGSAGLVLSTDINESMLKYGRARVTDRGLVGNTFYVQADAESLPFCSNFFDCISIGFGLRNVTDQTTALQSIYRCLKPGGRVLILEFSRPTSAWLRRVYDAYSFNVVPKLGQLVTGNRGSYQYLVESIRKQPAQSELRSMMGAAGFERVRYYNLSGGIVAVHSGYKF